MNRSNIRVLFSAEAIAGRNRELVEEIKATNPKHLLVIAVLKGSFVFAADLIRAMDAAGLVPEVEFMSLSSYLEGTVSSGNVRVVHDIEGPVAGRDVLLVDDILESGRTLTYAKDLLMARGARSVRTCVLLEKPGKRAIHLIPDHVGFTCPDLFVVGYGMDVAHNWRQLPFVGVIED